MSVFDGKGNEEVVVTTSDEEGKMAQGTGPSAGKPWPTPRIPIPGSRGTARASRFRPALVIARTCMPVRYRVWLSSHIADHEHGGT